MLGIGEREAHSLCRELISNYVKSCDAILEAGSGSGNMLRQLSAKYNARSCGIDPYTTEKNEGLVHFRALKAEMVDQLPRRYDLIYSVHSLHHFDNPKAFIQGVRQKLAWNGKVIIVDWKKGALTGVFEKYYSLNEVQKWFDNYGFLILEAGNEGRNFYIVATLKKQFLAVATDDGKNIFHGMFGKAPFFDIYSVQKRFKYEKRIKNIYSKTLQHLKTYDVYNEVSFAQGLLAEHIGNKGIERLRELGVKMFFDHGDISKVIEKITKV